MILRVKDMSSAMGKASHTRVRVPRLGQQPGHRQQRTTSWRQTETMRL